MDILVKKSQKVDMTKAYPGLQRISVHMNWKVVDLNPTDFEIDAAAFLLGDTGKTANDEPPVMKDVIKYYTEENKSEYPAFIVFISDGGIHKNKEIKQIMQISFHLMM